MAIRKGTNFNNFFVAGAGGEQFDGLLGYDIVSYATAAAGVTIDVQNAALNAGMAAGDTFKSIEAYRLSAFNDTFDGSAIVESINGGLGNDNIDGRGGNDQLAGHTGNDTLTGGLGNDGLWGGGGNDIISGGDGNDKAYGDSGNDSINGGAGVDLVAGSFDSGRMTAGMVETFAAFTTPGGYVYQSLPTEPGQSWSLAGWGGHSDWTGNDIPLTLFSVVNGNAIYVMTNNSDATAVNWTIYVADANPQNSHFASGTDLYPGRSVLINMGPIGSDGGHPRWSMATLTNDWGGLIKGNEYTQTDAQMSSNASASGFSVALKTLVIGDTLTGGADADTFVYAIGHGVDRITDFVAGVDHIDVANTWFDGNVANGEYKAVNHANGAVIVFTDNSVDGFVDHAAIQLAGITAANVRASFFI